MENPYHAKPDSAFWSRTVAGRAPEDVDPVVAAPFRISRASKVATAGSCFAQHISRSLVEQGYDFLVTEPGPDESYGVFPARFGNIYTVRQLRQLFERAYGRFQPADTHWRRADGRYIDPFRPRVEAAGYATPDELATDRSRHLEAVRRMFEECDVFVFTLGLTEAWVSTRDDAVFPFARGVVAADGVEADYGFVNFPVDEMIADLRVFLADLKSVNPRVRVILTVSPVPLVATYEDRHVLVSTTYSKAALRVVAEAVTAGASDVAYFPSFEIITGPQARGRYFGPDSREVSAEGVAQVMAIFSRHFLDGGPATPLAPVPDDEDRQRYDDLAEIICDEDILDL
jgi:hypothetical protein